MKYIYIEETDIKVFYADVINILNENDIENNIVIDILEKSKQLDNTDLWLFAKVVNNYQEIELIIIRNEYEKVFISSPTNNTDKYLYDYLIKKIYNKHRDIKEINGKPEIVNLFVKYYTKKTNKSVKNSMNIKGMVLYTLNPINTRGLNIRKANNNDYEIMTKYEYSRYIDVFGIEPRDDELKKNVEASLNFGTYLLEDDGVIVSQAVHKRKISIGGVYTPEKYRGKGYSTICTYLLAKKILDSGARKLVIYNDKESKISNYIYEKIGFVYKFDLINIIFE